MQIRKQMLLSIQCYFFAFRFRNQMATTPSNKTDVRLELIKFFLFLNGTKKNTAEKEEKKTRMNIRRVDEEEEKTRREKKRRKKQKCLVEMFMRV